MTAARDSEQTLAGSRSADIRVPTEPRCTRLRICMPQRTWKSATSCRSAPLDAVLWRNAYSQLSAVLCDYTKGGLAMARQLVESTAWVTGSGASGESSWMGGESDGTHGRVTYGRDGHGGGAR